MKIIYIAGPYRADTEWGVEENIETARSFAAAVLMLGAMPICPHMNTAHMGGVVPDQQIFEGDLEIMRRCDAVWMIDGWEKSVGARSELTFAIKNRMEIIYSFDQMKKYLAAGPTDGQG